MESSSRRELGADVVAAKERSDSSRDKSPADVIATATKDVTSAATDEKALLAKDASVAVKDLGADGAADALIASGHKDISALETDTLEEIAEVKEGEAKPRFSIWENAKAWREANKDKVEKIRGKRNNGEQLTEEYGKKGVVDSKRSTCQGNPDACLSAYTARLNETGRTLSAAETTRLQTMLKDGGGFKTAREEVLFEEATQEIALEKYQERIEAGEVVLSGEAIAADMLSDLQLEASPEIEVGTLEEGKEAVRAELREFLEKGFINESEMALIIRTVEKFGDVYASAFAGKRFKEGEIMSAESLTQHAFEAMRDNARKIAFQTKKDKEVFSGSDHGTRHICEGCTHLSEQMMQSLAKLEKVDFKEQDEVLIRQAIIDHDIGYTTDAAQAKGGFAASKDHPCAGCDFIEKNKEYYVQKFGEEGYETMRDVVLNHSYAQSEYTAGREDVKNEDGQSDNGVITYNRELIRSVVSSVDTMGVTSETKSMDFFRYPESIDILHDVKLYAETHDGEVDDEATARFKEALNEVVQKLVDSGRIQEERAKGYRSAIENQFNKVTAEITLGQFTGVVREMRAVETADGKIIPEISMEMSRLAAIVGDTFGEETAIKGFNKAMNDFGLSKGQQEVFGETVAALKTEKDPDARKKLIRKLTFNPGADETRLRARFVIGQQEATGLPGETALLPDAREQELQGITERFDVFQKETIRSKIRKGFEGLRETSPDKRTQEMVLELRENLRKLFDLDDEETLKLASLNDRLQAGYQDNKTLDGVEKDYKQFKSTKEKERLKRYEKPSS